MDHPTSELIEAQMAETRQSLTEKVSALEESVVGTMQSATTAVQDTVQNVRSAVEGTVQTVRRQFESVFDVHRHVREHPWVMIAGASAAGFLTGLVLRGGRRTEAAPSLVERHAVSQGTPRASSPGLWDSLIERFSDELKKVGESAIQGISGRLQQLVQDGLPNGDTAGVSSDEKPNGDVSTTYPIGRWNGAVGGARM